MCVDPAGTLAYRTHRHRRAGSVGVLLDDVLGFAIVGSRPAEHWSVSTDITVDWLAAPSAGAQWLQATAELVHADAGAGYATAEIHDDTGLTVARGSQRGRYVPASTQRMDMTPAPSDIARDAPSLADLLGGEPTADGSLDLAVSQTLQNPMGSLHGGVALAAADVVATACLAATAGPPLQISSIRSLFLRPTTGGATAALRTNVVHRGRSFAVLDVSTSVGGKLCTVSRISAGAAA